MTTCALLVVERRGGRSVRLMRIMTGEAGEPVPALQKASALAEIYGLVTNVPGVVPINGDSHGCRRAVAGAAELIQLCGREPGRIPELVPRRICGMGAAGSVTTLAAHSNFCQMHCARIVERNRTGRMTFETAGYSGLRIADFV